MQFAQVGLVYNIIYTDIYVPSMITLHLAPVGGGGGGGGGN